MNSLLKTGSHGSEVLRLTESLHRLGLMTAPTDTFDRATRAAVIAFQSQYLDERGLPLRVDGVVGPLTWWALMNPRKNASHAAPETRSVTKLPPGGSRRGRAALAVAFAEIAAGAGEQGGNNRGPFVDRYLNGIVAAPADWCAGFVSFCFDQHPDGCPFGYTLGARDVLKRCRARGWGFDPSVEQPMPGDIVVWRRGAPSGWQGHVGLVVETTQGGILHTVEGNRGGYPSRVRTFSYPRVSMDALLGYARVPDA
jgi:hypothetical protein